MEKGSKIFVAGHRGLVGGSIWRLLEKNQYTNIIVKSHNELDLCDQDKVALFFNKEKPEYVFLAAAKVGGIYANATFPADFIYQNISIQTNVIHQAYLSGVKKLIFLGSSCIYPRDCQQPIKEEYLLTGKLEPTNEAYAIAKISGIKMCEAYNRQYGTDFIAAMPTNLYGPHDNFDLETSHVIPALIRKFHEAKINRSATITLWGSGKPRREFLYVDDLAHACVMLMNLPQHKSEKSNSLPLFNVGCGEDLSIKELAELIGKTVGYEGSITWDTSKPDGTPQKLLDMTQLFSKNWRPEISLQEGIRKTYDWYVKFKS